MNLQKMPILLSGAYTTPESSLVSVDADIFFCVSNIKDLGGHTIVDEEDEP